MAENGKGALFKNDKKSPGSSQPDYTGNVDLTVDLLEALLKEARATGAYKTRLAAWIKQGKTTFLSVSINAPYDKGGASTGQSQGRPAGRAGFDDSDAPF